MFKIFRRRVAQRCPVFDARYIDPKGLFLDTFNQLPSVTFLTGLDVGAAFPYLLQRYHDRITGRHQHAQYNAETGVLEINACYLVLHDPILIETGNDYVAVFHTAAHTSWAVSLMRDLGQFRCSQKETGKIGFQVQQEMN